MLYSGVLVSKSECFNSESDDSESIGGLVLSVGGRLSLRSVAFMDSVVSDSGLCACVLVFPVTVSVGDFIVLIMETVPDWFMGAGGVPSCGVLDSDIATPSRF